MSRHHLARKNPSAAATAPDGYLPAALRRLKKAIYGLADPQPQLIDNQLHHTDSRYEQLRYAVHGQRSGGTTIRGGTGLPVWTDALDLLIEITHTVRAWYRHGQTPDEIPTAPTVACRLDTIAHRGWRPQDVRTLDDFSTQLEAWSKAIDTLLSETHTLQLTAACPACQVRIVQQEQAGELVNRDALQINANGCRCINPECHTEWAPQYFLHLARVIGCPPLAGILE